MKTASPLRARALAGAAAAFAFSLCLLAASREPAPAEPVTAAAVGEAGYYAALSGNQVAIYLNGRAEPVLITDIDARTLPDADRERLAEGIPLDGAADVNRLLEDYSG